MMTPMKHQIDGANFLASRKTALLADQPRVGKTGTAIMACDMVGSRKTLVVTTASGRPVWARGFNDWSIFGHKTQIVTSQNPLRPGTEVAIIGWPDMRSCPAFLSVWKQEWDVILFDEGHYAKNMEAKRTQAAFGDTGIFKRGKRVWCLTGTPMPNSPFDLHPMLAALAPERLAANTDKSWSNVSDAEAFKYHFCKVKPKKIGFHRYIQVIIGGQNLDELAGRLDGFYLRRTQKDVGITAPVYEILPLAVSPSDLRRAQDAERSSVDAKVLGKIASGDLDGLKDDHLGPVRRLWGELKVSPLVALLKEEFEDGLDKVVIAAWHTDVIARLCEELAEFGAVALTGSTSARDREANVKAFQTDPACKVFIGNIQAAGEAIDLSAAAELIFAESSFVPKDMAQMAFRITNHGQSRIPRVRVAVIEGSIDDAFQTILMRKWATINEVMK